MRLAGGIAGGGGLKLAQHTIDMSSCPCCGNVCGGCNNAPSTIYGAMGGDTTNSCVVDRMGVFYPMTLWDDPYFIGGCSWRYQEIIDPEDVCSEGPPNLGWWEIRANVGFVSDVPQTRLYAFTVIGVSTQTWTQVDFPGEKVDCSSLFPYTYPNRGTNGAYAIDNTTLTLQL